MHPVSDAAGVTAPTPLPETLAALLALPEASLEAALAAAGPRIALAAVLAAPTLERKTALLWALEDAERRAVLAAVPPPLLAALIQNLPDENRYLLGDLSFEAYLALLDLCSPERQFRWLLTALSFTDARANLLPLLLPTRRLAELLATRSEFARHVRAVADHPVERERLPPDLLRDPAQAMLALFGEDLLRHFPVADPDLERVLRLLLEWDSERYADLLREALEVLDYAEQRPEEWTALAEDPVLLRTQPPLDPEPPPDTASPMLPAPTPASLEADGAAEPPVTLVPLQPRALTATPALPAGAARRVEAQLQQLIIRQAVAEGGSFLLEDLRRTARSVEAYLLLGLRVATGGDPRRAPEILATAPLTRLHERGARVVERLRQVALRLRPLEAVLEERQQALIASLLPPRLELSPENEPLLLLLPGGDLPEHSPIPEVERLLSAVALWCELARALGLEATARALRNCGGLDPLLESLALRAVMEGRLVLPVTPAPDAERQRFREQFSPRRGEDRLDNARALLNAAAAAHPAPGTALGLPLLEEALLRVAREPRGAGGRS